MNLATGNLGLAALRNPITSIFELAVGKPAAELPAAALEIVRDALGLVAIRWWDRDGSRNTLLGQAGEPLVDRWSVLHLPASGAASASDFWEFQAAAENADAAPPALPLLCGLLSDSRRLAASRASAGGTGTATADGRGTIIVADDTFRRHLLRATPGWDGRQLPFLIDTSDEAERHGFAYQGLHFRIQRVADHYRLQVWQERRSLSLSKREMAIVQRVAEGHTYKEIAAALSVAPSTVSTQLYRLYSRLGLRRRRDLIQWFAGNSGAP